MTVPPGGPYGQGPYGANPYGQDPYWGQPQGGGTYPYPQTGPNPYAQGGQYPYPPPGGYPPPPYPPPGQQFPPGGPVGPYPPGPPPGGSNSKLPWLIIAGLVVLGVIALVATLVVMRGGHNNKPSTTAAPPSTSGPATQPKNAAQSATDCTPNVSGGPMPTGDTITSGKLSFPTSAAPGWTPFSDDQDPNLIGAVGVGQEVPGANNWMMTAEVAVTNFVPSMDINAQASKFMQCLVAGPAYARATPTLGPTRTSSLTVDGTKAARVDADITVGDPTLNTKGDSATVIAVDTKPITIFFSATPLGDAASAGTINNVIGALKVAKP